MGIPDSVTVHPDIAARWDVPCVEYQCKLGGDFGRFTIEEDGKLVQHRHGYVTRAGLEIPLMKRVELGDHHLPFHGDIIFWGATNDGCSVRLAVRLSEGVVNWIKPLDDYPRELLEIAHA